MNKYLLTASLLGLVSDVSAASGVSVFPEPSSPSGVHGAKNGGMCSAAFKSSDVLVTEFPSALRIKRLAADSDSFNESIFPISRATRVVDFIAEVLTSLRVPSASRFMFENSEVMKDNVNPDGTLITLATIFSGVTGIPTIEIVMDSSRSPMMTPTPQPLDGKISPLSKSPEAE